MKISLSFSGLNNILPDWQKVIYERQAHASEKMFSELFTYNLKEFKPQIMLISENGSKIIV